MLRQNKQTDRQTSRRTWKSYPRGNNYTSVDLPPHVVRMQSLKFRLEKSRLRKATEVELVHNYIIIKMTENTQQPMMSNFTSWSCRRRACRAVDYEILISYHRLYHKLSPTSTPFTSLTYAVDNHHAILTNITEFYHIGDKIKKKQHHQQNICIGLSQKIFQQSWVASEIPQFLPYESFGPQSHWALQLKSYWKQAKVLAHIITILPLPLPPSSATRLDNFQWVGLDYVKQNGCNVFKSTIELVYFRDDVVCVVFKSTSVSDGGDPVDRQRRRASRALGGLLRCPGTKSQVTRQCRYGEWQWTSGTCSQRRQTDRETDRHAMGDIVDRSTLLTNADTQQVDVNDLFCVAARSGIKSYIKTAEPTVTTTHAIV